MASLRIEAEGGPEEYALETLVVVLGRSLQSDVRIKDIKASRRHCQVAKAADGYHVVDLGSGNGTWLNGVQVKDQRLASGDRIQIGGTVVTFVDAPAGPPPPRKPAPAPVPPTERAEMETSETEPVPVPVPPAPSKAEGPAPEKPEAPPARPPKRGTTKQAKNRAAPKPAPGKKMNPLLIVAIVAAVLVLAAIAFFAMRGDKGSGKKKTGSAPAVVGRR